MLYHCGLLDEQPEKSRQLQWIRRKAWGRLPEDVERELRIFLAMPGFGLGWLHHHFLHGKPFIARHVGGYEQWKAEVAENWLSATRDDCVRLALMRPGMGDVPVISQLRAIQDVKAGMTAAAVGRDYNVHPGTITDWVKRGIRPGSAIMPSGFSLLGAS